MPSEPPPDTTPPRVQSTVPTANATRVAPGANITATFKLFRSGTTTAIGAVVSYDATAKKAILNPNSNLQLGTKYKAVVTSGATDLAGNRLDQNSSLSGLQQEAWTFTIRN
jgi:Bacterial Ig-like domain